MADDKTEGRAKDVGGKIKESAGQMTGDKDMKRDGQKDQVAGKAQHKIGEAKDVLSGDK